MDSYLVPILIGLTSGAAYLFGTRGLGFERCALRAAFVRMLESLGAGAVFLVVNILVGGGLILLSRPVQSHFFSLHIVDDVSMAVLSVLQGLVFHAWRSAPRRSGQAAQA